MVALYARLVEYGARTIESIPEAYREAVKTKLGIVE